MNTKFCFWCQKDHPIEDFPFSGGQVQSLCRFGRKQYTKQHYQRNKQKYSDTTRRVREYRKDILHSLKTAPCVDCGVSYPSWVMQFDHRDPSQKLGSVSDLVRTRSMDLVFDEIAKCDLVCANCHSDRTYRRANNMPLRSCI